MTLYEGKNALIFGGTSGIGLATAQLLLARGATVTVASNEPLASKTIDHASKFSSVNCDVRDSAQVSAAVEQAAAEGHIDWLVYSAGVQRYGTVVESTLEQWDLVHAVNARGAFLAAHYAIPRMRRGGAIVHVSSVQGTSCQQGVAAYAASKGALDALTRAMAVDHSGAGIRVNAVLPGTVDTPMVRASAELFRGENSSDETLSEWGRLHPIGRVAQPAEIASAIAFLLSDDASFISGSLLTVDGGLLAQLSVRL